MNGIGLCLDIETCRIDGLLPPPPVVAYGNTVDPLKRRAKEDEAAAQQLERLALDPHYGAVCCHTTVAFDLTTGKILEVTQRIMDGPPSITDDRGERETLSLILDAMSLAAVIVTFGGSNFDLPFVLRRSAILRAVVPSRPFIPRGLWYRSRLHSSSPVTEIGPHNADVYAMLSESHNNATHCPQTLDEYRRIVLAERASVWRDVDKSHMEILLETEEGSTTMLEMCKDDCLATYRLYQAIERYYP